jgi:ATP/maltotriose-dependent transcriptional regulator MalT
MQSHPVLLTKIKPPQISARALERPRITAAVMEALHYRLTILHAGAGYGKSTAVMSLVERHQPLIWYQISREDADPFVFLQHLLHATRIALPEVEGLPITFLEAWDGSRGPLPAREALYRYLNALNEGLARPALLVLFVPYGIVGTWRLRSFDVRRGRQRLLDLFSRAEGRAAPPEVD